MKSYTLTLLLVVSFAGCARQLDREVRPGIGGALEASSNDSDSEVPVEEVLPPIQTESPSIPPIESSLTISLEGVESGDVSTARNFVFVIDGSGSMGDRIPGQSQFADKLEGAKWAVEQFLAQVPDDVQLGLIIFDGRGAREVLEIGPNNRTEFLSAVQAMSAGGGTPLYQSVVLGVDQLVAQYKKQLGYGEFRLVVVSDGQAYSIVDAGLYAEKYRIPLYTIGLCMEEEHELVKWSVWYRSAQNMSDLAKALTETLAETETFDPTEFEGL